MSSRWQAGRSCPYLQHGIADLGDDPAVHDAVWGARDDLRVELLRGFSNLDPNCFSLNVDHQHTPTEGIRWEHFSGACADGLSKL